MFSLKFKLFSFIKLNFARLVDFGDHQIIKHEVNEKSHEITCKNYHDMKKKTNKNELMRNE